MKSKKLGIIIVLLFTTALIPLVISDVSAKCIEGEKCLGTPIFRTLKTQVDYYPLSDITCPNQDHLLVERPTGELACISEHMAEKTGWYVHYENKVDMRAQAAIWANGMVSFAYFEITGAMFDEMIYEDQTLTVSITPKDKSGLLSLDLPFGVPSGNLKYCNSNYENPPNAPFVIIIDDVEYEYHQEKNSRGQSALNIPLTDNSETIEILRTCYSPQDEFLKNPQKGG